MELYEITFSPTGGTKKGGGPAGVRPGGRGPGNFPPID